MATCACRGRTVSKPRRFHLFFTKFSNWISRWLGSHWVFSAALVAVIGGLLFVGIEKTNVAISVATLLIALVLQNTLNRDSAAIHVKLDELITHLKGPRDDVSGIESKPEDEIQELRDRDP